jgi:hypothetical protein
VRTGNAEQAEQRDSEASEACAARHSATVTPEAPTTPAPARVPEGAPLDPLEHALQLAAVAGRWDVVTALARELEARRLAAAGVPQLAQERARRG